MGDNVGDAIWDGVDDGDVDIDVIDVSVVTEETRSDFENRLLTDGDGLEVPDDGAGGRDVEERPAFDARSVGALTATLVPSAVRAEDNDDTS